MLNKHTLAITCFVVANCCLLSAAFFAPYSPTEQHRDFAYAPPVRLHWVDQNGGMHIRPFIYPLRLSEADSFQYSEERTHAYALRFFNGNESGVHLFSVDAPAEIFLFGTDGYGRDIFSRILFGGRISLAAALVATLLSLALGTALGAIAGYFGGIADNAVMRTAELALALPWLYLLLAIRAILPLHVSATQTFLLISGVIGIIGWARPARLIRSVVLSARERSFVTAARGFGASEWYLLRRHVLPQTAGIVITQAVILVPQFITAEATLSFLGLGMAEPLPSWGNMLSAFQQFQVMSSYWWMAAPVVALVLVSLSYFRVADLLHSSMTNLKSGHSYA
jgi:peptide/nickel transport system permease protein